MIATASLQIRHWAAMLLVLISFVFMPGAMAHRACLQQAASQSGTASCIEALPSPQEDGGGDRDDEHSHHGVCCKCPCHGLKTLIPPAGNILPTLDLGSNSRPSYDEIASDSPASKIFQPPKLLI